MLENKVGMIFGVANKRSIAWACAEVCAAQGAKLAFTYQGERLKENVEKLTKDLPDSLIVPCDVTNQSEVDAAFETVGKKYGKVYKDKTRQVNIFGNLGIGILPAPLERFTQNDVLLYGVAGIFRVSNRFNLVSEVNGRASTRSGRAPLGTESTGEFRLGTQIKASGLRFDAAGTIGLSKNSPRSGVTFGVTYQSPTIFTPAQ